MRHAVGWVVLALAGSLAFGAVGACSSSDDSSTPPPDASTPEPVCDNGTVASFRFESGSPDGHADPYGAKAANQARAGRLRDASMIVQSPERRAKVRPGDFVLANDSIAVVIEAEGPSDGYNPHGGEILTIDPVGDDGRPIGASFYGESIIALSRQVVGPEKVSVIADGSDGKAAVVRAQGVLRNMPFLDTFAVLLPDEYGFPAAIDYVLEPGSPKVTMRVSLANTKVEPVDFLNRQFFGFFHGSRGQQFTQENGFAASKGEVAFLAWDGGPSSFAFRSLTPLRTEIEVSGFQMFSTKGLAIGACEKKTFDYAEVIGGGPGIDGLLEAKRRALGEPAWREVKGTVKETNRAGLANAFVVAASGDGHVLTRAKTDASGAFTMHLPSGAAASLTPVVKGWPIPAATALAADASTADLTVPTRATIKVTVKDKATNEAIPARVQVLPTAKVADAPEAFGIDGESNGRLWNVYALDGTAEVPVPPGEHRVVVTRGYEWEIYDAPATAEQGKTTEIAAVLEHSVDSTGVMCADFHIHSWYSADSSDPPEEKVRGAIADGLEIPVSSEHEWVIDFQPIVQRLGMTKYAFGMPSEELTTFQWGHFGVVPLYPKDDQVNNGAIGWVGKKPPEFFAQVNAIAEKPVFIVNHPDSTGFQGYFSQSSFDRTQAKGTNDELWSDAFGALEVFNDSSLDDNRDKSFADWASLANAGKTYWLVGNSDSHTQRSSPVGYPRNCLRFGHDDPTKLTPEIVRDVLRSGNNVVSGGISMSVAGPDGAPPGATAKAGTYTVTVAAPSWLDATTLEVIVDGATVDTKALGPSTGPGPGKKWQVAVDVAARESRPRHWVVFHARGSTDLSPLHPGRKPFAVSNPIFF